MRKRPSLILSTCRTLFFPVTLVYPRYLFLCDPANNSVLGWQKANLMEAETAGFDRPELVEQLLCGAGGSALALQAGEGKKVSCWVQQVNGAGEWLQFKGSHSCCCWSQG